MSYDIFISYKHFSEPLANNLWYRLVVKGYSVFYDKEEMGRDRFDEQIFQRIKEAKDFLVVMEKHSLDACKDGTYMDDWFCKELMYAMEEKKNIVPIIVDGSSMPSRKELPDELKGLELKESPEFSLVYFNAFIEKLEKQNFLLSKPSKKESVHAVLKFRSNQECDVYNERGGIVGKVLPDSKEPIYQMLNSGGEFLFTCINCVSGEEKEIFKEISLNEERFVFIEWDDKPQRPVRRNIDNLIKIQVKGVTFNMIKIEGGTFMMGAGVEQGDDAWSEEKPQHEVMLDDYIIGETPVTQELWNVVMQSNPSRYIGNNHPVENISWNDCQSFIKKINDITGKKFALPTEAQWEFAARGGKKSKKYKYSGGNSLKSVGWAISSSIRSTQDVKIKEPNELGLYDMSGNVWEWCVDSYTEYTHNRQSNPKITSIGSQRVRRGGCWATSAIHCRVTSRDSQSANHRSPQQGFRLVLNA